VAYGSATIVESPESSLSLSRSLSPAQLHHPGSFSFVHSFSCTLDTSSLFRHLRMCSRVCLAGLPVTVDALVIRMRASVVLCVRCACVWEGVTCVGAMQATGTLHGLTLISTVFICCPVCLDDMG
jgi:hypothetical protein